MHKSYLHPVTRGGSPLPAFFGAYHTIIVRYGGYQKFITEFAVMVGFFAALYAVTLLIAGAM